MVPEKQLTQIHYITGNYRMKQEELQAQQWYLLLHILHQTSHRVATEIVGCSATRV